MLGLKPGRAPRATYDLCLRKQLLVSPVRERFTYADREVVMLRWKCSSEPMHTFPAEWDKPDAVDCLLWPGSKWETVSYPVQKKSHCFSLNLKNEKGWIYVYLIRQAKNFRDWRKQLHSDKQLWRNFKQLHGHFVTFCWNEKSHLLLLIFNGIRNWWRERER